MARFIAAMDESARDGRFFSGGFVAPEEIWRDHFVPAWDERVLAGPPRIPYLHMTDARDSAWRDAHGLTALAMERRVNEAARVIASTGPLALIGVGLDREHLRSVLGSTKFVMPTRQPGVYPMEPDYIGFLHFAHVVLIWVDKFQPDASRVDFLVERKQDVSRRFGDFCKDLGRNFEELEMPTVSRLVGELRQGEKTDLALQAADFALWHGQRLSAGNRNRDDIARWRQVTDARLGMWHDIDDESISDLAAESKLNTVPDPRKAGRTKQEK